MFRCELRATNASFRETAGGLGGFARECTESRHRLPVVCLCAVISSCPNRQVTAVLGDRHFVFGGDLTTENHLKICVTADEPREVNM